MDPDQITDPTPLNSLSFEGDEGPHSRYTLAAYLLLTGLLFTHRNEVFERPREGDFEERLELPSEEDLQAIGINSDITRQTVISESLDFRESSPSDDEPPSLNELSRLAKESNDSENPGPAAHLVARACQSDDELIRICALGSAIDFFNWTTIDLFEHLRWFLRNAGEPQTADLFFALLARIFPFMSPGAPSSAPNINPKPGSDLIAIHGTVLPFSQANRPDWSVPPNGDLFSYLQKYVRPNIYASNDYFRWEGGYTDYARAVAGKNLYHWLSARNLHEIDVVAHSHGCNVVMDSTRHGTKFGKTVFLSCPVHWKKYHLRPPHINSNVISVRTKFDYVIMMDRGGQRFPNGTITEHVLPIWFSHNATTKTKTWKNHKLEKFL